MTENGNESPPLRKLTVKNFSVIKEAELEFGKITVLIGPQSSGKSLLCKLAYFLGKEVLELAVTSITSATSLDDFKSKVSAEFSHRFPNYQGTDGDCSIKFEARDYSIQIALYDSTAAVSLSPHFESTYRDLCDRYLGGPGRTSPPLSGDLAWAELNFLIRDARILNLTYISAGRSFFANASFGFNALLNIDHRSSRKTLFDTHQLECTVKAS